MRRIPIHLLLRSFLAVIAVLFGFQTAAAQNAAFEAELPHPLLGDRIADGSSFTLMLKSPWHDNACTLAPGTVLHATIQSIIRAAGGRTQGLTFAVEAPCGDRPALDLVVTSLLAAPVVETVIDSFPGYGGSPVGNGGTPSAAAAANFDPSASMRGTAQAVTPTTVVKNKLPPTVHLGEVWRLPHLKLVLPSGDNLASEITTTGLYKLAVPENTIFILQRPGAAATAVHTTPVSTGSAVQPTKAAAPAAAAFILPCHPGRCTHQQPAAVEELPAPQRAGAAQDLLPLGFRPEHEHDLSKLEPGTTVHFLGENELLLTFPTHGLVRRSGKEQPTEDPQPVRAVLFQLGSRSVEQTKNWIVNDHNAYIWPLGPDLLVHEGGDLKVYGPGLRLITSLPLPMPLASLRVAPDGRHILLGLLRELHSRKDHQMLVETDVHGPKEEVLWSVLDGNLKELGTLGTSSNFAPTPVLMNDGLIDLRKGHEGGWFLIGRPWEAHEDRLLGSLRSACIPTLDGTAPDLLAVTTCDLAEKGLRTDLLHEDGSPIVERAPSTEAMPVFFAGASAAPRVAMLVTRSKDDYYPGKHFHVTDIKAQTLEVVGARDGAVLAAVPVDELTPYSQAFALSPTGTQLACVAGHTLTLYTLGGVTSSVAAVQAQP